MQKCHDACYKLSVSLEGKISGDSSLIRDFIIQIDENTDFTGYS